MDPYYTLPGRVSRGVHYTAVAGSSPVVGGDSYLEVPLGLYEDAIARTRLYPGERVNMWTDGQNERDAFPARITPLRRSDVEQELTVDELEGFLQGQAVVPGPAHLREYDFRKVDDRIEHESVEKEGLFPRGSTYIADPTDISVSDRLSA